MTVLSSKCKDFGLTEKALEELAELGSKGLSDDASDEDINKAVDLLVPYAKAMQGEITRKTQKPKPSVTEPSNENGEGSKEEGNENNEGDAKQPEWFKPFADQLNALKAENEQLKAEKAKSERESTIAAKAKELGIPDFLVKHLSIADDADIDKELQGIKQELVTSNLMPKGQGMEMGTQKEAMEADAKSWAESLPDK